MPHKISIVLGCTVLLLAGCGQKEDATVGKNAQEASSISADGQGKDRLTLSANGQQLTMRAHDGQSVLEVKNDGGVNVTGKLPGFVNLYPGAKVVSLVSGNNSGTLKLEMHASPSDVIGFYKQRAEAAGFQQTSNAKGAGNLMYAAGFAGRTVQVATSPEAGRTHAVVSWSSE